MAKHESPAVISLLFEVRRGKLDLPLDTLQRLETITELARPRLVNAAG